MNLKEAVNASTIWAARGYNDEGACVVSISYYGDRLLWRNGISGSWTKTWVPIADGDYEILDSLEYLPSGPKPEEQIEEEILAALSEMHDDDFEPMGEK